MRSSLPLVLFWSLAVTSARAGEAERLPVTFLKNVAGIEAIFTEKWTMTPVAVKSRPTVRKALERAAARYPASFVRANVRGGIYVADDLTLNGVAIGGNNIPEDRLLILGLWGSTEQQPVEIEKAFHHELLHVLLESYPKRFPKQEWLALNPRGFRYVSSGMEVLKNGQLDYDQDPIAQRKGFASAYGMAEFDEDVATVAESLLTDSREVFASRHTSPRLLAKARLLVRFYQALVPSFQPPKLIEAQTPKTNRVRKPALSVKRARKSGVKP